jgi:hypothetical protein
MLQSKKVTLRFQPLDGIIARVTWDHTEPPSNIVVLVDDAKDGKIRCVVHELLHVELRNQFDGLDATFEEAAILAFEELIFEWIKRSPQRIAAWRRAIDSKLSEQEGEDE